MQYRMKKYQLSEEEINNLFERAEIGRLATINEDGFPYVISMHFVYYNDKIYLHGLPKGQKIDNINRNSKVCFEIDEFLGNMTDNIKIPCDTEAKYNSIVAFGLAKIVNDINYKREVFNKIVDKYTPQFSGFSLPENMVKGTAVIEIEITSCTGKYHK